VVEHWRCWLGMHCVLVGKDCFGVHSMAFTGLFWDSGLRASPREALYCVASLWVYTMDQMKLEMVIW
jgi:hypothetical protein